MFPYILHIHDGVIHERTYGNRHSSEAHSIECQPHVMEDKHRDEQGKRKCDKGYDSSPDICEEKEKHDYDKERPFQKGILHIVDRAFYESRLAENVCRDMHVRRKILFKVMQCGFQLFCQLYRACIRLLCDSQQDCRLAFFGSKAEFRLVGADLYICHILQCHRSAVHCLYHSSRHLLHIIGGDHAPDNIFIAVFVYHPSVDIVVHISCYGHDFLKSHTVMLHLLRMQKHLVFLDVPSKHRHLGDASSRKKPRPDCPVGYGPQIKHRCAVCGEPDYQDFSEYGRLRSESRVPDIVRKAFRNCRQFFRHYLSVEVDVSPPVELHPYDRKSCCGR